MFKNLRQLTRPLLRAVKANKIFLAVVLTVLLMGTGATVYANVLIWRGTDVDGYGNSKEVFLSCGSTAGNYFFNCDQNGNCTDLGSGGADQACHDEGY